MKETSFSSTGREIIINKPRVLEILEDMTSKSDLQKIRLRLTRFKENLYSTKKDLDGVLNIDENGGTIKLIQSYLLNAIKQIEETQTLERTKYYLERLKKGISEVKTNKINDINLNRWQEYEDIITDSLWLLSKRDSSGEHSAWYWGNFIPQIPHQLMMRYTKKNDWVLDTFLGSGTTLIECRRMGRNGIGIELNPETARKANSLIKKESNVDNVVSEVVAGNSSKISLKETLDKLNIKQVQLIIMHPPYHDIIKFTNKKEDLSNAVTTEAFIKMFGEVLDNTSPYLETGRYLAIVIGDKYYKGTWIPLGFKVMNEALNRNFQLKSIIVKNFEETQGKRNKKELWRYRALVGGFYIFKHEYILLFKKDK
jgi:16S rRNA G966 N2-methylase RsmD